MKKVIISAFLLLSVLLKSAAIEPRNSDEIKSRFKLYHNYGITSVQAIAATILVAHLVKNLQQDAVQNWNKKEHFAFCFLYKTVYNSWIYSFWGCIGNKFLEYLKFSDEEIYKRSERKA